MRVCRRLPDVVLAKVEREVEGSLVSSATTSVVKAEPFVSASLSKAPFLPTEDVTKHLCTHPRGFHHVTIALHHIIFLWSVVRTEREEQHPSDIVHSVISELRREPWQDR